jgi:hypothetical protein
VLRLPAASSIQQPSQLGTLRIGLILFDEEIALFRHATLADSVSGVSSLLGCYSSRQSTASDSDPRKGSLVALAKTSGPVHLELRL